MHSLTLSNVSHVGLSVVALLFPSRPAYSVQTLCTTADHTPSTAASLRMKGLTSFITLACWCCLQGHVRATLQPDTVEVLDMMIQGTAAEVHMMEHSVAPAEAPHVHIEELNDGTN